MKKNPELTEQTKNNLVQAFWSLYAEKDLPQISVKEITEKAGYNRSTFYAYFSNTDEVLEYVVGQLFESGKKIGMKHECDMRREPLEDVAKAEEEKTRDFIKFYSENSKYLSVLFGKMKTPTFTKQLWDWAEPHYSEFMKDMSETQKKEISYVVEYHMCGMFSMIAKWYREENDISVERLSQLIKMLSTGGFLNNLKAITGTDCQRRF